MVWDAPGAVIVRLGWRTAGGDGDQTMFQVLRLRGERIVEMADYSALGPATKTAKAFAARP